MIDVCKKQRILITDPEVINEIFDSLGEHQFSEKVLDRLPDAPKLDEALGLKPPCIPISWGRIIASEGCASKNTERRKKIQGDA